MMIIVISTSSLQSSDCRLPIVTYLLSHERLLTECKHFCYLRQGHNEYRPEAEPVSAVQGCT